MNFRIQKLFTLLVILSFGINNGSCATGNDAKNLRTKLFITDGYDKKTRPSNNQSVPTDVYVSLHLLSINELSETTETLKTTGYLWISWFDDFLQWDPSNYGGIEYYHWPQEDIWKPDVALKNSFLEYKQLGVKTLNCLVSSNGYIAWYPFQVFQSTCSVDITYFPFDTQECKFHFVAWSYSTNEINMDSLDTEINMKDYQSNSEWDVMDTSFAVDFDSGDSAVIFTIRIKRKPLYVLLSVIMPIIMLAVLNIFVFVLPCDCGEKASYSITVFLAFAVFLSIISATFPENSEVVALFSVYLIIQTLQSTIITLLALVLTRFASYDNLGKPVPHQVKSVLKAITCQSCITKCVSKNRVKDIEINVEKNKNMSVEQVNLRKDMTDASLKREDDIVQNDVDQSRFDSWREVVNTFDVIFFVFFTCILIISTFAYFIMSTSR